MTKRDLPSWLPVGLLALALFTLFHRLFSGQALFWGLPALQFYPWRHFAFQQLRAGHLPAWNPYVGAGAPLLANYQSAIFYPPNWLSFVVPDAQAMGLIALLHIIWAGVGMWFFTGALEIRRFGRAVSMLAYALSGCLIGRVGSFPTADAAAWIPWIFWIAHRIVTQRRWRDAGWLGLAFGMQLLAGHAQTAWYGAVGVGSFVSWMAIWGVRRARRVQRGQAVLLFGAGMLLGAGIAAIQLVPTAEYWGQSQRSGGLDYETAANLSYSPFRLITLLSPNFYGTPADGSYYTKGIYFEDAAYIGFIPFISAIAALVGWQRKRRFLLHYPAFWTVPFWSLLMLGSLLIATGRYGPFFPLLYHYIPTFNAFREPVRWLILTVFSLSVLAGIGTQHWGRSKWVVFWSRLAAAGGAASVILALLAQQFMRHNSKELKGLVLGLIVLGCWIVVAALLTLSKPSSSALVSPRRWQVAVLLFITLDLAWAGSGLNPTVTADFYRAFGVSKPQGRIYWFGEYEREVKFERLFVLSDYRRARDQWPAVRTSLLPNLNMLDHVLSLNNFDPLLPQYHRRYIELIEKLGATSGPLLRAAGVSQVYGATPDGWLDEVPALSPAEATPLVWLVPRGEWFDSDQAVEEALLDPAWNPEQTVLLRGERPAAAAPTVSTAGEVTVLEQRANAVRYSVRTDGPAYLVISTTWYPGWSATIDGRATSLYRANLAFQAIVIPPGGGDVTLHYTANHWETGAGISAAALLIAFGLIALDSLALYRERLRRIPLPPD